jgi:phage terminase large subunit-like protein
LSAFAARLADELVSGWAVTARPNQLPPPGDWTVWLMMAGRGFGKTRTLAEMANGWASSGTYKRIALVCATAADARDVLVEGPAGILATAPSYCRPDYESSRRRLVWPNGCIGTTFSAEEPERLRGPQHDAAICDELGSWSRPETWDMLMFGLRLGQHPRVAVATTPRPTRLVRSLVAREGRGVVVTRGSSYENRENLAPQFFEAIVNKYAGTRLGRQELNAELLEDTPGALWTLDMLDRTRRATAPDLSRIVIAIDPAVSSKEGSDETGIIVAGRDDRHGYVLEDLSGRYAPADWARVAMEAYRRHGADRIVAETNQGGDMVEATLRTLDPAVSYSSVHATRGKFVRAEPVAALFEQSRAHLVGSFPQLEDQLTQFTPDMDRGKSGSPDRADAAIWALTELLVDAGPYAGLLEWYREQAELARAGAA